MERTGKDDLYEMEKPSGCVSIFCHPPMASLKCIIWLSNLWQSGPASLPRKPIGSSLCSRVTPTLISRLASPLRSLRFSTHVLSPLLSQRKTESDTRANYFIIPTRYKVSAKLVQLSGFVLFICGKQHNLTCLRLQVQRTQLGHIILPLSEIKSIYSANAQWLIKRW